MFCSATFIIFCFSFQHWHILIAVIINILAEFGTSQRGTRILKLGGYTYGAYFISGGKQRWRCTTHCNVGCRAVITTVADKIIERKTDHNHKPKESVRKQKRSSNHTIPFLSLLCSIQLASARRQYSTFDTSQQGCRAILKNGKEN